MSDMVAGRAARAWGARARWFTAPRNAALAAVLVGLPTIFSGFLLDDHIHLLTLDGIGYGATPFDLFVFGTGDPEQMGELIDGGPYPWYTFPALKIAFFRPLSSALMVLDRALFGEAAIFYHLHSVLWYALLLWGVALVYRRVLPGALAGLAVLLYVLDETHLIPTLWWSNRNALVAAAPAVLGLAAHLRWREDGWRPGLPLSLFGYGLGLLGGEGALGILGYVVAYEAFARRDGRGVRIRAALPGLLLAAVYVAIYKGSGKGVRGSGIYLDPVSEWPVFLASAPGRFAELAGIQFFGIPAEFAVVSNSASAIIRAVSIVAVIFVGLLLWQLWRRLSGDERRMVRWLGVGALLAAVPCLATFPAGRLLALPSLGACAIIALVLWHGLFAAGQAVPRILRGGAWLFLVLNLLLMPLVWLGASAAIPVFMRLANGAFAMEDFPRMEGDYVFCLYATDPYTGMYPPAIWRRSGQMDAAGWQCFSVAPFAHRVTRTGTQAFEIEVVDGELLSTPFERLMRSPEYPFAPGDHLDFGEYAIDILETGTWGPSRFRVTLDAPLESAQYLFLAWEDGELAEFDWPAIGESVVLSPGDGYFAWRHFKKRLPLL